MSTLSPQDHLDPHNPLYYAPRWMREEPERSSTPLKETISPRLRRSASPPLSYDAIFEKAVAEALRHPLDPEVILEPPGFARERDRQSALYSLAGRFAAAIGVSAVVALFFVIMVPASRDYARQPDGVGSSFFGMLQSVATTAFDTLLQKQNVPKFVSTEPETSTVSNRNDQPVATQEQSETLLQQFLQWKQKPESTSAH